MKIKRKILTATVLSSLALFSVMTTPTKDKLDNKPLSFINVAYAKSQEVEALSSRIEALPSMEDIKESDSKEVVALMKMYNELSMADKIDVPNFDKLEPIYRKLVDDGIITDEEKEELNEEEIAKNEQQSKEVSNKDVEAQTQEFVFDINEEGTSTVIARFTADTNGDGKKDVPDRIVLTSPEGKTYPITNTSVTMQDAGVMKINLTWTSNFLQLDFAESKQGRWSINTSDPVTFSQTPYAGAAQEIKPEKGKEELADVPSTEELADDKNNTSDKKKTDEKSGPSVGSLFIVVLLVGGIIAVFIKMKNNSTGNTNQNNKKTDKKLEAYNNNVKIPEVDDDISKEDILEELELYRSNNKNEGGDKYEEQEEDYSNSYSNSSYSEMHSHSSQKDIDNNYDTEEDVEFQEYKESGDTGLLDKDHSPFDESEDEYHEDEIDDDFTKF